MLICRSHRPPEILQSSSEISLDPFDNIVISINFVLRICICTCFVSLIMSQPPGKIQVDPLDIEGQTMDERYALAIAAIARNGFKSQWPHLALTSRGGKGLQGSLPACHCTFKWSADKERSSCTSVSSYPCSRRSLGRLD